jgi:Lipocalin-like domain
VDQVIVERLLGTWELVSYQSLEPDGRTRRPFGEAIGRITYDTAGNMTGQVMRPGRHPVDPGDGTTLEKVRGAYTGYIAYFGRYEVSPAGDVIVHHVAGALNPAMVGGAQIRRLRFEGERLVLEADVQKPDGTARHVLTWRRLS